MRFIHFILVLSAASALASCRRAPAPAATPAGKPVEQRIADLEKFVNRGSTSLSEKEANKEADADLAEIRSLGLVDRAQRDFAARVLGAAVESFRISYFMNTNFIWCDVAYKLPNSDERKDQGFGYKRTAGTNWDLTWGDR